MYNMTLALSRSIACIILVSLLACNTSRKAARANAAAPVQQSVNAAQPANVCGEAVKFYAEKMLITQTGQIMDVTAELVVDPLAKNITVSAEMAGQEKAAFEITIEQIDCAFNNDFTVGAALYTGVIKQKDGSFTKMILKLEAKDGSLMFSNGDPDKPNEATMYVSKWEIINKQQ